MQALDAGCLPSNPRSFAGCVSDVLEMQNSWFIPETCRALAPPLTQAGHNFLSSEGFPKDWHMSRVWRNCLVLEHRAWGFFVSQNLLIPCFRVRTAKACLLAPRGLCGGW